MNTLLSVRHYFLIINIIIELTITQFLVYSFVNTERKEKYESVDFKQR